MPKKFLISGVFDTRNNGCWVMANTTIINLKKYYGDDVSYKFILSRDNLDIQRLNLGSNEFVNSPILSYPFSRGMGLYIKLTVMIMPVLAMLYKYTKLTVLWGDYIRSIAEADLLIDISGDSFSKDYKDCILELCIPLFTAYLLRTKYCLLAQSIGILGESKRFSFFKFFLKNAAFVTAREMVTYKYLKSVYSGKNLSLTADLSFLQKTEQADTTMLATDKQIVGISISELSKKYIDESSSVFVNDFADFCDRLVEKNYKLIFVPHVAMAIVNDADIARLIVSKMMNNSTDCVEILNDQYVGSEYKYLIGKFDFFIGARMHATLAALSQTIPTITLVYNHKTIGINGKFLKQNDYLIDIRGRKSSDIISSLDTVFSQLINSEERVRSILTERVKIAMRLSKFNFYNMLAATGDVPPLKELITPDLCTGCGACVGACVHNVLKMKLTDDGYKPFLIADCVKCGKCYEVCPQNELWPYSSDISDNASDKLESCLKVVTLQGDTSDSSDNTSGGIVSSMVSTALQQKLADLSILIDKCGRYKTKSVLTNKYEDVKKCAGSKYAPSTLDGHLSLLKENRVCVVGLPCQITAAKKFAELNNCQNNLFTVGLFCGTNVVGEAYDILLSRLGIKPSEVVNLDLRKKGWPGNIIVSTDNITSEFLYGEWWAQFLKHHYPSCCQYCTDYFNLNADISCGDAWHLLKGKEKSSIAVIRTEKGQELFSKCEQSCEFRSLDSDVNEIMQGHSRSVYNKNIINKYKRYRLFSGKVNSDSKWPFPSSFEFSLHRLLHSSWVNRFIRITLRKTNIFSRLFNRCDIFLYRRIVKIDFKSNSNQ